VTSIDPGNVPGGLFWTVPLPNGSVHVNPGDGTATYQVSNLATLEFHDFFNDLLHGPAIPTTLSFTIRWGGTITARHNVRDTVNGFAGEYVYNSATMVWSASEPTRPGGPATFVSDPASTSTSDVAVVGHERNGVFFS
jgi:hypothetical protein